ncbi:hypothetical protein OPAG_05165 [Rhodococcus opacus PD630]|nr:hypothetical protein OPAG_05165 [Rhodococcus opacus PD630]
MPIASHSSTRNETRAVSALESVIACLSRKTNRAAPVRADAHRFHPRIHPKPTPRRQGGHRHPVPQRSLESIRARSQHPGIRCPGNRPSALDQRHQETPPCGFGRGGPEPVTGRPSTSRHSPAGRAVLHDDLGQQPSHPQATRDATIDNPDPYRSATVREDPSRHLPSRPPIPTDLRAGT